MKKIISVFLIFILLIGIFLLWAQKIHNANKPLFSEPLDIKKLLEEGRSCFVMTGGSWKGSTTKCEYRLFTPKTDFFDSEEEEMLLIIFGVNNNERNKEIAFENSKKKNAFYASYSTETQCISVYVGHKLRRPKDRNKVPALIDRKRVV